MSDNKIIAVIGLGYVGLPLAVEFGKYRPVIGFDINPTRIAELKQAKDHTLEVSPEELKESKYISYSDQPEDLKKAHYFIVTVPTPVDNYNQPDLTPLLKASETVGRALKKGDIVTVTLQSGPIHLTTQARALENGASGALVKVMNMSSRQVLDAVVTGMQAVSVRVAGS